VSSAEPIDGVGQELRKERRGLSHDDNSLAAAQGILLGCALGALFWLCIGLLIWWRW